MVEEGKKNAESLIPEKALIAGLKWIDYDAAIERRREPTCVVFCPCCEVKVGADCDERGNGPPRSAQIELERLLAVLYMRHGKWPRCDGLTVVCKPQPSGRDGAQQR